MLAAGRYDPGRLRVTLTGGRAPLNSGRGSVAPRLLVAYGELAPSEETAHIVTVPWPRNERGVLAGVKSTSYAENVVALAEAHRQGASEAIFANLQGRLCEGTGSNIGYVVDGEARTPTLPSGCLAGIARELLLEWAEVTETDEPVEVLQSAEEIFLLSTTRDVQPVRRCDSRDLVAPGPVTRRLMETFSRKATESTDP